MIKTMITITIQTWKRMICITKKELKKVYGSESKKQKRDSPAAWVSVVAMVVP